MLPELDEIETRVLGCLLEKAVTTPDQYPLTLNALTNACNQKSSREPVMSLTQGEVQRTARGLRDQTLLDIEENYRNGVEKYSQRLCNTTFSDLQVNAAEYAILCLLLLRGAQTPGELRARSGRLHEFEDNAAVVRALTDLLAPASGPLVVKLPRQAGRKDAEYMHQLCGAIDVEAYASTAPAPRPPSAPAPRDDSELAARVERLEAEVAELREKLKDLL